jgi:hypothetical protein
MGIAALRGVTLAALGRHRLRRSNAARRAAVSKVVAVLKARAAARPLVLDREAVGQAAVDLEAVGSAAGGGILVATPAVATPVAGIRAVVAEAEAAMVAVTAEATLDLTATNRT